MIYVGCADPQSTELCERIAEAMVAAQESHALNAERFSVSVPTVEHI